MDTWGAGVARGGRRLWWFVVALGLVAAVSLEAGQVQAQAPSGGASGTTPGEVEPGEILVKFKLGTPQGEKRQDHEEKGGRVEEVIPRIEVQVVKVEEGDEKAKAAEYEADPDVEFAEPNGTYEALYGDVGGGYSPDDVEVGRQWQYHNTGQTGGTAGADLWAFEAWEATTGSGMVPVAVLDTGIKEDHPDLQGKVTLSRDFTGTKPGAGDDNGHGTHVAGTIAANTNNGAGVAGTCPGCSLLNGKVLARDGVGSWGDVAGGIRWAADNGARGINLSLGGPSGSATVKEAIDYAWGKGAVVTAAAGNDGATSKSYPAAYERVISVAATDHGDKKAGFSNHGAFWVDVAAPGDNILSTTYDGKYGTKRGTSMAAPHVAGVAGLVWSSGLCDDGDGNPADDNLCVRDRLEDTADATPGTGSYWANGRVNACKAVNGPCTERPEPPPPPDTIPPKVSRVTPASGATRVSRATNVAATFSEDMDPDTLDATTVTLVKAGTATPASATVSYDPASRTVTLDPAKDLARGAKYKAIVRGKASGAKDLAGNPLAADKTWYFYTRR